MTQDLGTIVTWWIYIFGIGLIFLPLTKKIFNNFFDKGYLFSKTIGILFSSYLVWLLASLKILGFYKESIVLVMVLGLVFNIWIFSKNKNNIKEKGSLKIFIAEELIFFVALIFWSFIRGLQPDIQGLEKFMDFGFVNSILRSKYFPPADMWFAGKSINYYYFGHYITAFLTRLSGVNSAITYNLMIATLFAFCFSLTFSLTGNLVYFWKKISTEKESAIKPFSPKIIFAGLIAALLISLGANLHPAFYNIKMKIFKVPYCDNALTYWYPNATRYIGYCPDVEDKTIHEFPSYSFIVSDLHGHVSDIPFVLTFLGLCLTLLLKIKEEKETDSLSVLKSHFLIPVLLAIMFMTNQWDFPIYIMVLGLTLLWGYYYNFGFNWKTIIKSILTGFLLIAPALPLIVPFQLGFDPIAKGIALVHAHSRFYQLLILWGVPWFFAIVFIAFLFGNKIKPKKLLNKESAVKWFSKILGVEIEFKKPKLLEKIQSKLTSTDIFIFILLIVATTLVIIPEIIYVKDIYISSYHRANTMFKLTYQSFIMFSVSISYIFVRIVTSLNNSFKKKLIAFVLIIPIVLLLVYPNYSIPGYYGKIEAKNYKGLYGLNFLERLYPDDYRLVLWLNDKIEGNPVVLEAVGDSYTDFERISMATGLPTIEGWLVHEWLWRGSYDEPGKRAGEVQTIYESKDVSQTKDLLKTYNVKYLVVGDMERQKYPNLDLEKIKKIGKVVFESGTTALYEVI